MDWVKIAEFTALAVGLVAGCVLGWKEWKERKARSNGLAPNPTRCEDHETRLRSVEASFLYMSPQISGIESDVSEIRSSVQYLVQLHMKG
jgi:hypothetical protein